MSAKRPSGRREVLREKRAREQKFRIARFLGLIVCVALAFLAGFFARGDIALMTSLGVPTGLSDNEQNPGATVTGNTYDSISARIAEIEGILQSDSLDTYDLSELTSLLLDDFSVSTDDKYLRYYDEDRYNAFVKESAQSGVAGIGVLFSEYDGQAYAVDVFDGSSAQACGVEQGDFVIAVDGDSSQAWTATEVANALARDDGASVVITWRRPTSLEAEGGDEFSTTLVCTSSTEDNVTYELDNSVGYISLSQLTQDSSVLISSAITDLTNQGAGAFVLDLRDCPGGYLTQAVEVASLFLRSGVIVQIQTNSETTTKSASGAVQTDLPLVVLINANTAAAAEVLAAALQDSGRAELIGATTIGKGSVQVIRELSFGGALRYTAAYYKTPLGHDIESVGVNPDVGVSNEGDEDSQKTLALETAQSQMTE